MRYGIIDIGSNTIRLAVFEKGADGFRQIRNVPDYAGLISYVQNGVLSTEGEETLIASLNQMKETCLDLGCTKIKAFATASLRDVADPEGLCGRVAERTGLFVEIISGEKEAQYDCQGLQSAYQIDSGVAFDLGGGSCQVLCFEHGAVTEHCSMPIGSRRFFDRYVADTLPTLEEEQQIKRAVRLELSQLAIAKNVGCPVVYAMGGAARAALEIKKQLTHTTTDCVSVQEITQFRTLPEQLLVKIVPHRLTTIVPALITIEEICKYLQCDTVQVTDCGVREGVLAELEKSEL